MILTMLRTFTESISLFALANSCAFAVRQFHGMLSQILAQLMPVPTAWIPASIISPSPHKYQEQMTNAGCVKISYHQTRGCHVQRSKYGLCPGGRIRSLL